MNLSRGNKIKETIDFQFCNNMQIEGAFHDSQKKGHGNSKMELL